MRTELFQKSKKIVIKIGTSTMLKDGRFDVASVRRIAGDIVQVSALYPDKKFVIVSSGAIGMGMRILAKKTRPTSLSELQALAALGQPELMKVFSTVFSKHKRYGCQVLLTWNDFSNRKNYLKTQKALEAMLSSRMIPVINENDTVATEEIEFGDNDQLSSLVALMFHADLHILLTDSNGLYSDYSQGDASRISIVPELSSKIHKWVYEAPGKHTKGGMGSKLSAIDKSLSGSIPCVLASGCRKGVLKKLFEGKDIGTVFTPKVKTMSSKKHWIANLNKCEGEITIDDGAANAMLNQGRSLLASGILAVHGHFQAGSTIMIKSSASVKIGKGVSNFNSTDIQKIRGSKTASWRALLGHPCPDEVIHRDNFVKEKS